MTQVTVGIFGLVLLLILIIVGMRVAYAVTIVGILGIIMVQGWGPGTAFLGYIPASVVGKFDYTAIPLFVLMGYFAYYAGVTDDLYAAARAWVQHIPGGLPMSTILASAGFAAVSGASTAATGVLGKIAIPQMIDSGVDRKLAAGTVAMGGCLAALIPPSTIMIIYGIITEQSIGAMLMAGVLPGMFTVLVYLLFISIRARMNPNLIPVSPSVPFRDKILSLKRTGGMLILVILVIGGIYLGVFTPTEAAGVGAFGAFVMALALRRLNLKNFNEAIMDTVRTSAMIFAVMVGIAIFIRFLALAGVSTMISDFVASLPIPPIAIIIVMLVIYFILGMFMDAVSMLMLTLPIFFPVVLALDFNPIWFGILVVKMCEIGLVSPPVGLNCFIVNSVAPDIPLTEVFRGVLPFIVLEIITVVALMVFPQIITIVPDLMYSR